MENSKIKLGEIFNGEPVEAIIHHVGKGFSVVHCYSASYIVNAIKPELFIVLDHDRHFEAEVARFKEFVKSNQ